MTHRPLDDAAVEAVLRGRLPADRADLTAVADLVSEIRATAELPGPAPSGLLAELLETGLTPVDVLQATDPLPPRRRWVLSRRPAQIAAGVAIALAGMSAGAAADVLPAPLQDGIASAVETVTPLDVPDTDDDARRPARRITNQTSGPADQGQDGRARGAAARATHSPTAKPTQAATGKPTARPTGQPAGQPTGQPTAPGQQGLDRAGETPAQGHVPTAAPVPTARPAAPEKRATPTVMASAHERPAPQSSRARGRS